VGLNGAVAEREKRPWSAAWWAIGSGAIVLTSAGCTALPVREADRPLPNQVAMGMGIVTSGQPSRHQLTQLAARGYEVVLHIATPAPRYAVLEERTIVVSQGIEYHALSVEPDSLSSQALHSVASRLETSSGKKVLVHCDINVLAATLVFLYRVIHRHESLPSALADLEQVAVPTGSVRRFIDEQLASIGTSLDAHP
jgi:protein tyrosine phosphatase (PTP) superfamily phosphohydrolase (DUF442 family)